MASSSDDRVDFLRFSAYSIKDLITRKLSENSKFTDQIYEGSNLAILIDIVSYMYQCLIYQLNTAAAESMFADTQLYKNIVRLVKFIGYNPKGCNPSTLTTYITSETNLHGYVLPRYSYIDTGLTDSNGQAICFSTPKNRSSSAESSSSNDILKANSSQAQVLYNGKWKMYNKVFTASGNVNEVFELDNIKSDTDLRKYVAHSFIDIYVRHFENGKWTWQGDWELDINGIFCGYTDNENTGLFNNRSAFKSLYPGSYHIYNVTLNENKQYELRFGNGVVGAKLSPGDMVYVFYLETNGPDGKVETANINAENLKFKHSASMFNLTEDMYNSLFFGADDNIDKVLTSSEVKYQISFKSSSSSTPAEEESVEKIRENAPMAFMTGNRLVTRTDYEYYLKNSNMINAVTENVVDVKCMNNWEYMSAFYRWLYELGAGGKLVRYYDDLTGTNKRRGDPRYYLNKNKFTRYDYFYADASDANNIYLWLKTPDGNFDVANVTLNLNQQLYPIKLMTAELVACKAINVKFDICAAPEDYVLNNYLTEDFDSDMSFDENCDTYIEITLDDNTICVPNSIKTDIANIIAGYFNINSCKMGQLVKFDDILNSVYGISGVKRVRTIFKYEDETGSPHVKYVDGISFASWSDTDGMIKYGEDLNVSNNARQLEEFQFPVFNGTNTIADRIRIIKKSLSNVNTIKF